MKFWCYNCGFAWEEEVEDWSKAEGNPERKCSQCQSKAWRVLRPDAPEFKINKEG